MSQIHRNRKSNHPLVETVWATQNIADGVYTATPDASWDLIVLMQSDGSKSMMLTGQSTKPMDVPYTKGTNSVVISFIPGAYLPAHPAKQLLDSFEMLPNADEDHFILAGEIFAFPTFDTVEQLVESMIKAGVLLVDPVVYSTMINKKWAASDRSVQRHFSKNAGLTQKYIEQIIRTQEAVRQLQQGKTPRDVAADTGFYDQPHLARSLKKIMNTKLSQVDDIHKL